MTTLHHHHHQDILIPPFDAPVRHSTLLPATFNLVSTIVGGGVLTLPYAFQKCGLGTATVLFVIAAITTDWSLQRLCDAARRTGVQTYGQVAEQAFRLEWLVSGLLSVFLLLVLIAYMVLLRDIWTPLLRQLKLFGIEEKSSEAVDARWGNWVLLGCIILLSPFLVQRELYALRYNCYISFASISILTMALSWRALQIGSTIMYIPSMVTAESIHSFSDTISAVPIITLSFLSQFNVLPIQAALVYPTRVRIRCVIHCAIGISGTLMYILAVAGQFCFGRTTKGNILLNLSNDESLLVLLGRMGCGVTILLATPMMVLPCRRNILELIEYGWLMYESVRSKQQTIAYPNETTSLFHSTTSSYPVHATTTTTTTTLHLTDIPVAHYGSTLLIISMGLLCAIKVPGVAVVWSFCGSGMAFVIAFLLPSIFFLNLVRPADFVAWLVFLTSLVTAVVCTWQTTFESMRFKDHAIVHTQNGC